MGRRDESVTVAVTVVRVTPRAALLSLEGTEEWVPLSCLDTALAREDEGEDVEVEIHGWKAEELGWD